MPESESFEQRHARAAEVFTRFVPGVDPERVSLSMERKLGVLGSFAFNAVGHMWSRPQLSRRDRSLLVISILAAHARDEELEIHTQIGLHHGLTRTEIEEILPHVAAYAGFPAAMAASRHMDAAFCKAEGVERIEGRRAAARKSDAERERDAGDVWRTLTGSADGVDAAAVHAMMIEHLGGVGDVAFQWAFGEIWSRSELSRRDRSLVVITILASFGLAAELAFHVPAGLNHGLTRVEIEEIMTHLCLYAGIPRGVEGMRATRAAFHKIDAPTV
jgi:4-carboxymuconolactone decarboxylase